jgi:hypothetical protein
MTHMLRYPNNVSRCIRRKIHLYVAALKHISESQKTEFRIQTMVLIQIRSGLGLNPNKIASLEDQVSPQNKYKKEEFSCLKSGPFGILSLNSCSKVIWISKFVL